MAVVDYSASVIHNSKTVQSPRLLDCNLSRLLNWVGDGLQISATVKNEREIDDDDDDDNDDDDDDWDDDE